MNYFSPKKPFTGFYLLLMVFGLNCSLVSKPKPDPKPKRTNILLITADDLGYEAVNFINEYTNDLTPNLDKLASEGMSFDHAFVNTAICAPSRGIIATGRYGFNSGLFGFNKLTKEVPTVFGTLKDAGYLTGILGKVGHSTPDPNYTWDFMHDQNELGAGRSPERYYQYVKEFLKMSQEKDKPFYMMVNSHDPHRPFHDPEGKKLRGEMDPSKLYNPDDVRVPSYLPDLPGVRKEMSHYYNSVRRLDDTVGKILQALEESGMADNTFVIFITDNGSAFPFAKANTYLPSNRTACFVRYPKVIKKPQVDKVNFISNIDFFPTFMDLAGLPHPDGLDGQAILPLLKGKKQKGRDFVYTQIDYKIGGPPTPMRGVQNDKYLYIFNAWSDGVNKYKNNNEGKTMAAMEQAAKQDENVQKIIDKYRYREVEEFYDVRVDPGCTRNLFNDPSMKDKVAEYQTRLRDWMVKTNDHALTGFDNRGDAEKLAQAYDNYPVLKGR